MHRKPAYQIEVQNESELPIVVDKILDLARGEKKWFFHGEIGAGKTTFIKALASRLGVKDVVSSPTFSLINEYWIGDVSDDKIFHIDLYRIQNLDEALDIGIEDYLDNPHYCLIEWPEIIEMILPENGLWLYLHILENGNRQIDITVSHGSN